ncbi:MAG TPA: sigma-70 family RNA polymerase sigma factor [Ktedonobacterales bacterium]|nr:sigma-70 family RNA polymerase sigma factor [Ktedonobacterales bacterium]
MEYERFAPLVAPHAEVMARIAAALVGASDADDTAQEALMRAWRAWPSLRDSASARAWLMQITVNVCRTWRSRRQGLRLGVEVRLDEVDLGYRSEQSPPGAIDHVDALDLRRAVLTLDEDLRIVIMLRFYAGMDSHEIGDLLGASPATIRGRLRRGLLRLRHMLDDAEQSEPLAGGPLGKDT